MTNLMPGSRVFAVLAATDTDVQLIGFGTYVGDAVPPAPYGFHRMIANGAKTWEAWEACFEADGIAKPPRPTNPKLVLDTGEIVWGAECWWGPEDNYFAFRKGRNETRVSIEQARTAAERGERDITSRPVPTRRASDRPRFTKRARPK